MLDHCHGKKKEMAVTLFYISHHDADKNTLNIFYCHCKIIVQITEKKNVGICMIICGINSCIYLFTYCFCL